MRASCNMTVNWIQVPTDPQLLAASSAKPRVRAGLGISATARRCFPHTGNPLHLHHEIDLFTLHRPRPARRPRAVGGRRSSRRGHWRRQRRYDARCAAATLPSRVPTGTPRCCASRPKDRAEFVAEPAPRPAADRADADDARARLVARQKKLDADPLIRIRVRQEEDRSSRPRCIAQAEDGRRAATSSCGSRRWSGARASSTRSTRRSIRRRKR